MDPKLASNSSSKSADPKHHSYSRADLCYWSNNIILFGLPESSLLATKSAIDDMTNDLIGKSIRVINAFHLGRRSHSNNILQMRPRPILIKLDSCWDKLLASCRKLKGYSNNKLLSLKTCFLKLVPPNGSLQQ